MNKFLKRYKEMIGADYEKLLEVRLKKSIRINTLKISEKEAINRLTSEKIKLEKIDFLENAFFANAKFSIGSTPEYLQGHYYIQEAASQLPALVLDAKTEDAVLDMAAAPCGKTTQIAQMMNNEGTIIALDNEDFRLSALRNNLERCGIGNCIIYKLDGRDAANLGIKFDKILLDAPCSGNFIVDKKWFDKKSVDGFEERSRLQKRLLETAVSVLKKGGTLVYSTCSMEPEENEEVIDWALKNLKIKLEKIDIAMGSPALKEFRSTTFNPEVSKCVRIWPHKTATQPFFIAKIRV